MFTSIVKDIYYLNVSIPSTCTRAGHWKSVLTFLSQRPPPPPPLLVLCTLHRHYVKSGFLDLQPYELPGRPYNRTMNDKGAYQFHHDESLAVIECRQRMAGYTYVMSHDLDEFIIPRADVGLKPFFQVWKG